LIEFGGQDGNPLVIESDDHTTKRDKP
jgi:hypothetical protein